MQWFRRHNHLPSQIPQGIQVRTVNVTSAQILTMGSQPVTLISAAGPNTVVMLMAAYAQTHGDATTPYTHASSDARLVYEGYVTAELAGVGSVLYWSVLGSMARDSMYYQDGVTWETAVGDAINKNIVLTTYDGVNPIGGTSDIQITMAYMVINLA